MSSKLAAVRKNRKPPPFLSEFDRGVTKKMLRQMWEDEIIDDFDYEVNSKMLAESKKTPADMSDTELKEGLKKFKAWYPGQTREEMVYMLTYRGNATHSWPTKRSLPNGFIWCSRGKYT